MFDGEFHARLTDTKKSIILAVMSDPKPNNFVAILHRRSPVMNANSRRPKPPYFFEMKRGVAGICLEQKIVFIGQLPYVLG